MKQSSRSCAIFVARSGASGNALGCSDGRRAASGERRARRGLVVIGKIAVGLVLLLVLTPSVAHAWTPGTHVFLGEAVMRSLSLLPGTIADLLHAFPYDFLYGSIAADTSIAKKYAP